MIGKSHLLSAICLRLSESGSLKRFIVPLRMQDNGWLALAVCVLLGFLLSGPRLGLLAWAALAASLLLHEMGHMVLF